MTNLELIKHLLTSDLEAEAVVYISPTDKHKIYCVDKTGTHCEYRFEILREFQRLTGCGSQAARAYLDTMSWNLEASLAYYERTD